MKVIKALGNRRFNCVNNKMRVSLDFNYLVDGHNLIGNFIIIHWNKIFRAYALYYSTDDYYTTFDPKIFTPNIIGEYIEVFPTIPVLPTAAVLYRDCLLADKGMDSMRIVPQ